MQIAMHAVEQILREVAASHLLPYFRHLSEGDIAMKGVDDPVTRADKIAEVELAQRLMDYLPGSVVVGEEAHAANPLIVQRLAGDQPVWLIDPIDGTANFIAGRPEFGIMLALIQRGQATAAWIYDPLTDSMLTTQRGAGVWLAGHKLTLAQTDHGIISARLRKLIAATAPDERGWPPHSYGSCASFDYPRLFTGDATFANATSDRVSYLFYPYTRPWDHVPGLLMHHECGGHSADWSGVPYHMVTPGTGLLIASSREQWEQLHQRFQPLMATVLEQIPLPTTAPKAMHG